MEEILKQSLELLGSMNPLWLALGLFGAALLENIFPFFPGDTMIVFGGFLAYEILAMEDGGLMDVSLVYAAIILGNLFGATLLYIFGAKLLALCLEKPEQMLWPRLARWLAQYIGGDKLEKARQYFCKWGLGLIIFSRFLPGIRFFIMLFAGLTRQPFWVFLACFTLASLLWNSLLFGFGWYLREHWELVLGYLQIYTYGFLIFFTCLILFFIGLGRYRRSSRRFST